MIQPCWHLFCLCTRHVGVFGRCYHMVTFRELVVGRAVSLQLDKTKTNFPEERYHYVEKKSQLDGKNERSTTHPQKLSKNYFEKSHQKRMFGCLDTPVSGGVGRDHDYSRLLMPGDHQVTKTATQHLSHGYSLLGRARQRFVTIMVTTAEVGLRNSYNLIHLSLIHI